MTSTIMLLPLFFILFLKTVTCLQTTKFEDVVFVQVAISNSYCSSHGSRDSVKIFCDFEQRAAYLGNATLLHDAPKKPNTEKLELEIRNCSRLQISSEFISSWRNMYSSIYLTIDQVEAVVQEEFLPETLTQYPPIGVSDLISISMKNVKMDAIFPYLMSDTNILMVNIWNSSIGVISKSTFQNVDKLWQLRICQTNISRLDGDSMSEFISVSNAPEHIHVEWAPFIFNETNIENIEPNALKLLIPERSAYFNIIYSNFTRIQSKAIHLVGVGHVLIADSIFHSVEDDAISVGLKNTREVLSVMDYPTLTIMGLEMFSVDIANFMNSFHIENGKIFLIRVSFLLHGRLQQIIDNVFGPSKSSESFYIEQMMTECSCDELVRLNLTATSEEQEVISSVSEEIISEMIDGEHDPSSSINLPHIKPQLAELYCHVNESYYHVNVMRYYDKYCTIPTTIPSFESTSESNSLLTTPTSVNIIDASESISSVGDSGWYLYSLIIVGVCGMVCLGTAVTVYVYRQKHRRGPYYLRGTKKHQPNRKHVGVISENPICEEEGEDEIQV